MVDEESPASGPTLRTLQRGLNVLDLLATTDAGLTFGQVAQRLALAPGTVDRLLQTLIAAGYVEQDPRSKTYQLGLKILELQGATIASTRIASEARPHMRKLMLQTGERVHLAVYRGGDHVVHIDRVDSQETIGRYVPVGRVAPVHATSLGKAIMAFSSEATVDEFLENCKLQPITPRTITTAQSFRQELAAVRKRGYATELEESQPGLCCIGAPVFDYTSKVVAAVSLAGPMADIMPRIDVLGELVRGTTHEISATFGFRAVQP
jgi:IclR family transcriptional regulator, KDG regulon repressor